jgi:hypothetical protein
MFADILSGKGGEILLQNKEEKSSYKARRRNPPTKQGGEILLQSKEEKSSYKARRIEKCPQLYIINARIAGLIWLSTAKPDYSVAQAAIGRIRLRI